MSRIPVEDLLCCRLNWCVEAVHHQSSEATFFTQDRQGISANVAIRYSSITIFRRYGSVGAIKLR